MENTKNIDNPETVCNFIYLSEMMAGKKSLIIEIIDAFQIQISDELKSLNEAVEKSDYLVIKGFAHTMKSTVSIMGISVLNSVLNEMEALAKLNINIEQIRLLNSQLNIVCLQALGEVKNEKNNLE